METADLFAAALCLQSPWKVVKVSFLPADSGSMELHIDVDFNRGAKFSCPVDGCGNQQCAVHDTVEKTWRHMNFFQYKTYIHARVPRIDCREHGVRLVSVPWARPGSGFTLLFEAMLLEMCRVMNCSAVSRIVGEHDTRIWKVIQYYVSEALEREDYSQVSSIGIDETSKKGHNYVTVVADLNARRAIFVTDGKDRSTVKQLVSHLLGHKGSKEQIRLTACDMSLGFKAGIRGNFPNASIVIDKFHVIKHCNECIDKVRKRESKGSKGLKGTKYLWLKNDANLSRRQLARRDSLVALMPHTARSMHMRLVLQEIYEKCSCSFDAEQRLRKLCSWIMHARIPEMKPFAALLRSHWEEILAYWKCGMTNALLEGLNSVIQNLKRGARGFRSPEYFKTMIYLVCGKLDFSDFSPTGKPFEGKPFSGLTHSI